MSKDWNGMPDRMCAQRPEQAAEMNHSPSSAQSAELPTVARLYYTGIGHRRYKRASTRSGTGEPLCFVSVAEERLKVARATAEYWKAEHNAANQRIAELEANAAAVATPLEEANRLLHEQLDTARDTIGKLRAAASSQATGQPEPIYQVQTSCNGWSDHSRAEYEAARLSRRIVYATPPSPDAASAHPIGEDAANVAIGEREAFEAFGRCECTFSQDECEVCESNREAYRERQMENGIHDDKFAPYRLKVAEECCERLMSACTDAGCPDGVPMDDWIRDVVARAALTAEKVAGKEAVADAVKLACQSRGVEFDIETPGATVLRLLLWEREHAAPQPAQPVAQTLALTDERIGSLPVVGYLRHVPYVSGYMFDDPEPAHDKLVFKSEYAGDEALVKLGDVRALLAAQPASSLAEGDKQ